MERLVSVDHPNSAPTACRTKPIPHRCAIYLKTMRKRTVGEQPTSYRDQQNAKLMGVCAGVAIIRHQRYGSGLAFWALS